MKSKRTFLRNMFLGSCGIIILPELIKAKNIKLFSNESNFDKKFDKPWKWSREAMFYETTSKGCRCLICPNECLIRENSISICQTRLTYENKLYTIAYGNPCAVHIDPIEKKPLYHFLPGSTSYSIATAGCNLSCLNCQNWTISQASPKDTRNYDLMPNKVVSEAKRNLCKSISYTYSEPIVFYEYTYDTAIIAKNTSVKNVLVSAGYINKEPLKKLATVIDAANIDLKSFSDEIYKKLNGGKLQPILETLITIKEMNVWLEITNLIVPQWTDNLQMIRTMCKWLYDNGFSTTPLHFSRFYPQYKLTHLPPTPTTILKKAKEIALEIGLKYVYIGNVPEEDQNTYCHNCKKLLIERKGYSILQVNIINNKCKFCNITIPGIWQ